MVSPDAAPIKRLVQAAKESGRAIDATQGRKTKAVLITDGENAGAVALQPETIAKRFGIFSENETKGNTMADRERFSNVVSTVFQAPEKGTADETSDGKI